MSRRFGPMPGLPCAGRRRPLGDTSPAGKRHLGAVADPLRDAADTIMMEQHDSLGP